MLQERKEDGSRGKWLPSPVRGERFALPTNCKLRTAQATVAAFIEQFNDGRREDELASVVAPLSAAAQRELATLRGKYPTQFALDIAGHEDSVRPTVETAAKRQAAAKDFVHACQASQAAEFVLRTKGRDDEISDGVTESRESVRLAKPTEQMLWSGGSQDDLGLDGVSR